MFQKFSTFKIIKTAELAVLEFEKEAKRTSAVNSSNVLEEKDTNNFLYFVARAIDADIPNGNGDYFPLLEIEAAYKTFIGKGLYLNHDSDKVEKAVGKIIDAYLVKDSINSKAWVECICKIDKKANADIVRQVEVGIIDSVSMGCTCERCVCSACDKEMFTRDDFCDHMKTGLLRKFPKGGQEILCYSINKGLVFNELSLVNVPADPEAKIHKIIAQKVCGLQTINIAKLTTVLSKLDDKELEKFNALLDLLLLDE